MANRYVAGASGLPFAVLRGYAGTDLPRSTPTITPSTAPSPASCSPPCRRCDPTSRSSTRSRPTGRGNVLLWGITGVQKEAVLAAARSIVTVEEIVDELDPPPGAVVLPGWVVTAVAEVPGGAPPSYAAGYSVRDNDFYQRWDAVSRDRDAFQRGCATRARGGGAA